MSTTTPTDKNDSHSYRPTYIELGTDTEGGTHLYRTSDETVFAFDADGHPEYRFDVTGIVVDDYVAHVTACRGWAHCRYGRAALVDQLARFA